jgi:hypothetical protein
MPATIKLGDTRDDVKRLQRVFVRTKELGRERSRDQFLAPQKGRTQPAQLGERPIHQSAERAARHGIDASVQE